MNNKKYTNKSKLTSRLRYSSWVLMLVLVTSSCQKYLDIVPDNLATIDNAFTLRNEAEKFLFKCYSYLPSNGQPLSNVGFLAGDEMWIPYSQRELVSYAWQIARGNQGISDPYMNYWDGRYQGGEMFEGIRNCNIFIENVSDLSKVPDLGVDERARWIAEAEFLKAFYHYTLWRMYGPIPIVDKNLEISASAEEVKVKRAPSDSCVSYISNLLDKAAAKLPSVILDRNTELGRITKSIALAVKAKLLVTAASPLYNGNKDYANYKDKDGVLLFSTTEDPGKWTSAYEACKTAVAEAETAGAQLYKFPGSATFKLSDQTLTEMSIRQSVCERWNDERIWGLSGSRSAFLQWVAMGRVNADVARNTYARGQLSAPLKMAELFYTKNGVPITEDKTLDFSNKYGLRTAVNDEFFLIEPGYTTARINFDREPRFYADLAFDGGKWFMYSNGSDSTSFVMKAKSNQYGGTDIGGFINETGYFIKKLVDWNFTFSSGGITLREYEWPEIRLADLYLLYAEAANEANGPSQDVYQYLDIIRSRAGLKSVQESWTTYSNNPTKYQTKEGLRDIIKRERGIELAFEGSRFWDLRRWKDAANALNAPITGWSVTQSTDLSYYLPRTIYQQTFVAPRDYFWPIRQYNITVNPNLVQNLGW